MIHWYKYYVFGHYPSSCLYLKTILFISQNTTFRRLDFILCDTVTIIFRVWVSSKSSYLIWNPLLLVTPTPNTWQYLQFHPSIHPQPLWALPFFFQFLNPYTVGRTPWTGISPSQGRYLHTEQHKQSKRTRLGFESTIPVFKRAKKVQALDRAVNCHWNLLTDSLYFLIE
jgi:hypothetical protein